MKVYHRTFKSQAILREGFRGHLGVWVSDGPLDANSGAEGDALLVLEIPEEIFAEYEWAEEGKGYRESLVPVEVLNSFSPPKIADEAGGEASA